MSEKPEDIIEIRGGCTWGGIIGWRHNFNDEGVCATCGAVKETK